MIYYTDRFDTEDKLDLTSAYIVVTYKGKKLYAVIIIDILPESSPIYKRYTTLKSKGLLKYGVPRDAKPINSYYSGTLPMLYFDYTMSSIDPLVKVIQYLMGQSLEIVSPSMTRLLVESAVGNGEDYSNSDYMYYADRLKERQSSDLPNIFATINKNDILKLLGIDISTSYKWTQELMSYKSIRKRHLNSPIFNMSYKNIIEFIHANIYYGLLPLDFNINILEVKELLKYYQYKYVSGLDITAYIHPGIQGIIDTSFPIVTGYKIIHTMYRLSSEYHPCIKIDDYTYVTSKYVYISGIKDVGFHPYIPHFRQFISGYLLDNKEGFLTTATFLYCMINNKFPLNYNKYNEDSKEGFLYRLLSRNLVQSNLDGIHPEEGSCIGDIKSTLDNTKGFWDMPKDGYILVELTPQANENLYNYKIEFTSHDHLINLLKIKDFWKIVEYSLIIITDKLYIIIESSHSPEDANKIILDNKTISDEVRLLDHPVSKYTIWYKYRFRYEFRDDMIQLLEIDEFWASLSEIKLGTSSDPFHDKTIIFESYLTMTEVRHLINTIEDSHYMYESLNYSTLYTGERWFSTPERV